MIIMMKDGLPAPDLGEWTSLLKEATEAPAMCDLALFLEWREKQGATIYPERENIFTALRKTPPSKLKAVILGQDPYHGEGQAHGLAFSVRDGVAIPPSLQNIHEELHSDLGLTPPTHGNLESWAEQGVLLLNTLLTVEKGMPMAHKNKGWEKFTDNVIKTVSEHCQPSVFILWGSHAQKKKVLIDESRHGVIESVHPSPLSAYRGFFGSQPFSKTNEWLASQGRDPIDWKLP